jgi:hypothetical protein
LPIDAEVVHGKGRLPHTAFITGRLNMLFIVIRLA